MRGAGRRSRRKRARSGAPISSGDRATKPARVRPPSPGRARTAASRTAGWAARWASISAGSARRPEARRVPPTRPRSSRAPSSRRRARVPVRTERRSGWGWKRSADRSGRPKPPHAIPGPAISSSPARPRRAGWPAASRRPAVTPGSGRPRSGQPPGVASAGSAARATPPASGGPKSWRMRAAGNAAATSASSSSGRPAPRTRIERTAGAAPEWARTAAAISASVAGGAWSAVARERRSTQPAAPSEDRDRGSSASGHRGQLGRAADEEGGEQLEQEGRRARTSEDRQHVPPPDPAGRGEGCQGEGQLALLQGDRPGIGGILGGNDRGQAHRAGRRGRRRPLCSRGQVVEPQDGDGPKRRRACRNPRRDGPIGQQDDTRQRCTRRGARHFAGAPPGRASSRPARIGASRSAGWPRSSGRATPPARQIPRWAAAIPADRLAARITGVSGPIPRSTSRRASAALDRSRSR